MASMRFSLGKSGLKLRISTEQACPVSFRREDVPQLALSPEETYRLIRACQIHGDEIIADMEKVHHFMHGGQP
jgi:hypothetical protein